MDLATLLRQSSNAGLALLSRERSSELAQFLRDVSHYPYPELNTRQAEFLLKLRDDKATHFKIGDGLSVAILIEKCFQARFDLHNDHDIEFIESLHSSGRTFVTGRQLGWFIRICKKLVEIEDYV